MPDDELQVSIDFEEELSKGTKKINAELERLEKLAAGGFGKATREAKKTEDQLEKTGGAGRKFLAILGRVGKFAAFAVVTAGLLAIVGLFKAASAGVRGFIKLATEGFRLLVRIASRATMAFFETAESLDKIAKVATRLGVGTEALRELRFAAAQAGVDARTLDMAIQRMTRRMGELAKMGRGEAKPALDALGLSVEDFAGKRPEEQFEMVADALAGVDDRSQRLALAFKFFDAEGTAVLQMLGEGAEGLRRYREQFVELAGALDDVDFENVEEMQNAFGRAGAVIQGLKDRLVAEFSPAITTFIDSVVSGALKLRDDLEPAIESVSEIIAVAADFIPDAFGMAWEFAAKNQDQALAVLKVVLIEFAVGAGTVIVQAFQTALKLVTNLFVELLPAGIKMGLGLLIRAIIKFSAWQHSHFARSVGIIVGLFEGGWDKIKEAFKAVLNFIIRQYNWLVDQLAAIDIGGVVGVASSKIREFNVDTQKAAGLLASAKARGDEFANAVLKAGDAIADFVTQPFEVDEEELKNALGRAVKNAGPEIQKLFGAIITTLQNTLTSALEGAKDVSPAFAKLVEDLQARLELAKQTVAEERKVTDELEKQRDALEVSATKIDAMSQGIKVGLFGGLDEQGQKVVGLLEELQNSFQIGMEAARAAALGVKDIFAGIFLDLTDETVTWEETLQNALMGLLDLARNLAAELLATLLMREILAALEPAKEGAESATEAAGAAAAAAAMEAGAVAASTALTGGGAAAGASIATGGTTAAGALSGAGAALGASGLQLSASAIPLSAAATQLQTAAIMLAAANAGSAGFAKGGIMPGQITNTVPFQAFARGGVATSPTMALFSEVPGQAEAFVPLPDGRTIPVTVNGDTSPRAGDLGGGPGGAGGFTDARRTTINFAPVIHAQDAAGVDDVMAKNRELLREEVIDILANDGAARYAQGRNRRFS